MSEDGADFEPQEKDPQMGDSESDWDEEHVEVPDELKAGAADAYTYTMQSANGMVTITPAGRKKLSKVPPVDTPIRCVFNNADKVEVFTSFDEFQTGVQLHTSKAPNGDTLFTGTLRLPPGRYLIRYLVDGEWQTDDNLATVYSLGNEYNTLVVEDPDDEEQWGIDEDELPEVTLDTSQTEKFKQHADAKGMVTITPTVSEMDLNKLPESERALLRSGAHVRDSSVQWDVHRRQFVIAGQPASPRTPRQAEPTAEADEDDFDMETDTSASTTDGDAKKAKAREYRRKKKKRQKEKKKYKNQTFAYATATPSRVQSSKVVANTVSAELVKREREWREAWILHELKTNQERDKERLELRNQAQKEREEWLAKMKEYAGENRDLRAQMNEMKNKLEVADSGSKLALESVNREKSKFEEQKKYLEETVQRAQAELSKARDEAKSAQTSAQDLTAKLQKVEEQWREEAKELRSTASRAKISMDAALIQLESTTTENNTLKEQLAKTQQEYEKALLNVRQDTSSLSSEAAQRLTAAHETELKQLQAVVARTEEALTAARADVDAVKAKLAASQADKEAADRRADAAEKQLAEQRETNEKQQAEASKLREAESALKVELDKTKGQLQDAKNESKSLDEQMRTRKAEYEKSLDEARKEALLQSEAVNKSKEGVEKELTLRVAQLNASIQDKEKQLEAARSEAQTAIKELTEAKREVATLQAQLAALKQNSERERKESEEQWQAKFKQLEDRVAQTTDHADKTAGELKALQSERAVAEKAWETSRAELEAKLALAQSSSQQQVAALQADKAAAEQRFGERIKALEDAMNSKNAELKTSAAELATLQGTVNSNKVALATKSAEIDTLKAEVERSHKDQQAAVDRSKELQAAVDEQSKKLAAALQEHNQKAAEYDKSLNDLRNSLLERKAALDDALGKVEAANSKLQTQEAAWARERQNFERELAGVRESRKQLSAKTLVLANNSKNLRSSLSGFREQSAQDVAQVKSMLEDTKKFLLQSIAMQSELLATTTQKYKHELSERRKYFNMVQELRGNIRVFCRVRPMLDHDVKKGFSQAASFPEENNIKLKTEKRDNVYEFDKVFPPGTSQEDVFNETKALVTSCMDGYNVCIFAYGQTGSGKTFTMEGDSSNRGVNFRALRQLFRIRDQRKGDFVYTISVNMVEIYNETIRDLLSSEKDQNLKVHKGPNGIYVDGLTEIAVDSEDDVMKVMSKGNSNRAVGITNMNEHSSRSHSLLSVKVVGQNLIAGITYYGKLHLIDLAGSERLSKSGATGQRLKETQAINKSLSALGNVLESLQKKTAHIPYRDSKLTFLLQDSLGGHAKTLMFINVSPTDDDSEETFCSLNFASRVRKVELGQASRTVARPGVAASPPPQGESGDGDDEDDSEAKSAAPSGGASAATPTTTVVKKKVAPATGAAAPVKKPAVSSSAAKPPAKK